jgi:hypothetical protein
MSSSVTLDPFPLEANGGGGATHKHIHTASHHLDIAGSIVQGPL